MALGKQNRKKARAADPVSPEENIEKIIDMNGQPTAPTARRFVPDDDELALDLAEFWTDKVAYFHGSWYVCENGTWVRRDDYEVQRNIRAFLRGYRDRGVKVSQKQITSLQGMMRADAFRPDRDINAAQAGAERYINMRNGVYDLQAHTFIPEHKPDLMFVNQLDFDYDPDAECPVFERFIRSSLVYPEKNAQGQWVTDHDMVALLQQALGYSLTARTDLKASFWLKGVPDSGKSTLLSLIKMLMGTLATTIDLNQLGTKSFMLSEIVGKRTVSFSESSSNVMLPDALYKALIGGTDEIWADVKNGRAIVFKPIAKVWWAMNEMPRVSDRSGATFNRLKLIRFNRSFSAKERDLNLLGKLHGERAGIFNNLITQYQLLERHGWRPVAQSEALLEEYQLENDTERTFVEERCECDSEFSIQSSELYSAYQDWCTLNGFKPKNRNQVATEWRRLGFRDQKSSVTRWSGVRLKKSKQF